MSARGKKDPTNLAGLRVCWFGSARYRRPLDQTAARKWAALAQMGAELRVIGFAQGGAPRQFRQDAHFTLLPQSRYSLLRYLTLLTLGTVTVFRARWRHGCQTLIAQSPFEGMVCVFVAMLGRLFRQRTVIIVENHNDFMETLFLQRTVLMKKIFRFFMPRAAKFAIQRADLFRTISHMTAEPLSEISPNTPQIRFITWTDADVFVAESENRQMPPPNILYAGLLIPRKGVHHLLAAFAGCLAGMPQAQLKIVGAPTNAAYTRSLHQQTKSLGIADQVQFLGDVTQKELAALFANARCSVLLSLSEALGRVLIESQLTGTPVIATRVGGMPEIVREGATGYLLPAADPEALARALEKMLRLDERSWRAMSEKASAFAREKFSTEAYVAGYRELLTKARELLC